MKSQKQKKNIFNGVKKPISQQLIASILIIAMVLSLGFNIFLFKPKKAQAILGIGDIVVDVVNQVKDWVLDQIPKRVARHMMIRLQQEIARWAQGGFRDDNKPFAMLSWKQELLDALGLASARFLEEFHLTPLCLPIRITLGERLGLTQFYRVPYTMYAACTIETVVDNVADFWENPSIGLWGWDTWTALSQPQNNIYGSILLAAQRRAEIEKEEEEEKDKEIQAGSGYKGDKDCLQYQEMTDEQMQECKNNCFTEKCDKYIGGSYYDNCVDSCVTECEQRQTGICLEYRTKTIGSTIHSAVEKAVGSDIDWLITADEITEMFGLIFSGLFNKLFHGTGLASTPFYRGAQTSIAKYQAQYGYYESYKKAQTPEDKKKLRTDILDNILKAIKNVTTNSYECDKDFQLKGDVFSEVAADILDEESQHLYAGMEGVDLKPDFEVLDPWNAPFTTYGQTWDDIPFSRYPPKCSEIAGVECKDIWLNLPYELDLDNVNPECGTGCLGRINEYREVCGEELEACLAKCEETIGERAGRIDCKTLCRNAYAACEDRAIRTAVSDGKCSSYAMGRACLDGAKMINTTKKRCDECVENAQRQCEGITDPTEKQACIGLYCSNYDDISGGGMTPISSPEDFYNRCAMVEIKEACYVCLKEYFMPAYYCEIIYDFINRAFVKYPALVYEDLWWGMFNRFADCARTRSDPDRIPVGLTCRILPDFVFPTGGTCASLCNVTPEQLKDIADDRPGDLDCSPREWRAGAFHPGSQYIPFLVRKRSKCCVALTANNLKYYSICRGMTGDEPEVPPPYCGNGIVEPPEECDDGTHCSDGMPCITSDDCDPGGDGLCIPRSGDGCSADCKIEIPMEWACLTDQGEEGIKAKTNNTEAWSPPNVFNDIIHRGEAYGQYAVLRRMGAGTATIYVTTPYCDAVRYPWNADPYFNKLGGVAFTESFVEDPNNPPGDWLSYCSEDIRAGREGGAPNLKDPANRFIVCKLNPGEDVVTCNTIGYGKPVTYYLNRPVHRDEYLCPMFNISSDECNKRRICEALGIPWNECQGLDAIWSEGLWIGVGGPGTGGGELCICDCDHPNLSDACKQACP